MILFVYNVALVVGLVVSAPWWLWRMATTHKYREGLAERLGRVPERLLSDPDTRPVIWIHAVSVGEVLAVSRLIGELDHALPEHRILLSTTTRTGQELARQRIGAHRVFYAPLDLPWATRAYLNALGPELLVLAETEFWPNLLAGCFRRRIPVAVVNARISDRSWPRYRALRALWRPLLSRLSAVLAQSELDAERLRALGCLPDRVSVAGNLKFDIRAAQEADATRLLRRLAPDAVFVVAGSTLEGEESAVIAAHRSVLPQYPSLITVLAPRHPERFDYVAAVLAASGVPSVRRSSWLGNEAPSLLSRGQIVLLDSIGELASVYSLASVAFVGGSLVPAGGHNPLEPAQFGVPIVMGPHYANFRSITEDLRAHDALRIAHKENLWPTFDELLGDRELAQAIGQRAREVFEQQAGATARCVDAIRAIVERHA
ncbi:3-deoxy-D-manno-octulosonic acid transferase [Occallatibacter riparius]|uniref:3-deoxy-D-manno-octulosonic acid transferase n=1 Tax=Occallatibacter riparius TaxID=1002689 RepID=A0A9J7BQX5_9BACT|nr:3-deoxy-D-manno-octulosonic acid transferase [Occallatibacter riparius]UWZ84983.1 3-deoxy-D-manno-octulosonic acid transferase [Occallatibacter riparius]